MGCRGAYLVAGALTTAVLASCIGLFTEPSAAPAPIPTQRLAIASAWTCVLETSGEVGCLGGLPARLTPGDGSLRFVMIDGGAIHACGLTADSTAWCWGNNAFGQLGDGTTEDRVRPVKVDSPVKLVAISAGGGVTCGLDPEGRGYCWGRRERGAVGDGFAEENTISSRPVPVATSRRFVAIAVEHVGCGLTKAGRTYCWGYIAEGLDDLHGLPGNCGSSYYYLYHGKQCLTPTPLATSLRFAAIPVSSCGVTHAGRAYCWGQGFYGQLGDGRFGVSSRDPVPVESERRFLQLTEGSYHSCGLDTGGEAYCWGNNFSGQLGIGSLGIEGGGISARNVPTAVLTEQRFVELEAGSYRTCGLTAADELWCWGYNGAGSFGPGATKAFYPVPVRVEMPPA